jgi:hypothetical protein
MKITIGKPRKRIDRIDIDILSGLISCANENSSGALPFFAFSGTNEVPTKSKVPS